VITHLSKNTKYDKKHHTYNIKDMSKDAISTVEGEFSNIIRFDDVPYWEYDSIEFPKFLRMGLTLPSDSTFREDIVWLKKDNEDEAQKAKIKLEEIQRVDRKLRTTIASRKYY
jgi:hypothetical protein